MTVLELIQSATRLLNLNSVGEDLDNELASELYGTLNTMLDSWANDQYALYRIATDSYSVTSGTGSYTLGSGGTWSGTRPVKIESMYVRDSNSIDTPLKGITKQEYDALILKSTSSSYPECFYYDAAYSLATVYLYPVPSQDLTIYISRWMQFTAFTALTETVSLPPGYANAIKYNLAVEIGPQFGKGSFVARGTPIQERAELYLNKIKSVNHESALLKIDSIFTGSGNGFNIYAGR